MLNDYKFKSNNLENIINKNYRNNGNDDVLKYILKPCKVLDVGCGSGDNARILKENNCIVDGITISEMELKEASAFLRTGYLHNLENGLPEEVKKNRYDFIICSHVLEHICYPEKLLKDIRECLHPNCMLIVALPNLFHYKSRWQLAKGNFNYESAGIWDNTHFKWYTYKTGASTLKENGFRLVEKTVTGQLPLAFFFSRIFSDKLSAKIYNLLKKISPGFFGYQLLYVAEPDK